MTDSPCRGGPPLSFKAEPFLEAAEILVRCDEPLRAIALLENLPGYYRDNPPAAIGEMKNTIRRNLMMPSDYVRDVHEKPCSKEQAISAINGLTRGRIVLETVREYNSRGVAPHLIDMGPADYWLAQGLMGLGCIFSYFAITLAPEAAEEARSILAHRWAETPPEGSPIVFSAGEVIEHLPDPDEILTFVHRSPIRPAHIIISTPCYTYDERPNWRQEQLAHLRTYTPGELLAWAQTRLPGYKWQYVIDSLINLKGSLEEKN